MHALRMLLLGVALAAAVPAAAARRSKKNRAGVSGRDDDGPRGARADKAALRACRQQCIADGLVGSLDDAGECTCEASARLTCKLGCSEQGMGFEFDEATASCTCQARSTRAPKGDSDRRAALKACREQCVQDGLLGQLDEAGECTCEASARLTCKLDCASQGLKSTFDEETEACTCTEELGDGGAGKRRRRQRRRKPTAEERAQKRAEKRCSKTCAADGLEGQLTDAGECECV